MAPRARKDLQQNDAPRLNGTPALVSSTSRILVLGSFPSVMSLETRRYYGNPKNHFWQLLGTILADRNPLPDAYESRIAWLHQNGIAIWDVIASCIRQGSLDQNIRDIQFNDIAAFLDMWPAMDRILLNGGTAARLFSRTVEKALPSEWHYADTTEVRSGKLIFKLPSTSPVPSRSYRRMEDKVAAWRDALDVLFENPKKDVRT